MEVEFSIFLSKWVICRFQPFIFQGVVFSVHAETSYFHGCSQPLSTEVYGESELWTDSQWEIRILADAQINCVGLKATVTHSIHGTIVYLPTNVSLKNQPFMQVNIQASHGWYGL